jgi:glycosyltransferase involved in cell wall biosynthesis
LQYLAPQVAEHPEVELLIFDNASPDETSAVVKESVDRGLRCRYIRRTENIGPDGNFLDCYNKAAGKFLWIFGDDDVILPGCLARILEVLQMPGVDLVFVTAEGFISEPEERLTRNPRTPARLYRSATDFVSAVGYTGDLALISAVILNRERIESFPHPDFREGSSSFLIQLGWTFCCLNHLRQAVLFDKGLIATCEKQPSRPFDVVKVFGKHWKEQAQRFLIPGSPVYKAVIRAQLDSWFANNWLMMREQGYAKNTPDPVGQMKREYGDHVLFWIMIYPLLAWSLPLARQWKLGIRVVRRIKRRWLDWKAAPVPV